MDEYLVYLNTIKNIQFSNYGASESNVHANNFNNNYKKLNRDNFVKKKRFERKETKDYKDLDDPDNSTKNRQLISYDDL